MQPPPSLRLPAAIFAGSALIAAAILLRPAERYQSLYGDGYVYVVDLRSHNIANIIPGKTVSR